MNKVFEKHETPFCILLIAVYIVSGSFAQSFGTTSLVSVLINTALSTLLIGIMLALKKTAHYGLTKPTNAKEYLYFLPLLIVVSVNLWNGFNVNNTTEEIVYHILTMLNVGFIEEIIFRGFLFKMMVKTSPKSAVIVCAVTFGIGHIVNLINGADLVPTLMQVCYATSIGYLFVVMFKKSGSLIPQIVTHCLVNSLSIFNVENTVSLYIAPVVLTVAPLLYALYINKKIK